MAVTSFESKDAVYHLYYGRHSSDFDSRRLAKTVDLGKVDAVLMESAVDSNPMDEVQFTQESIYRDHVETDLTRARKNHIQAYTFAVRSGFDIWMTDVPYNNDYNDERKGPGEGEKSNLILAGGFLATVGGVAKTMHSLYLGDDKRTRRDFLATVGISLPVIGYGLNILHRRDQRVIEANDVNQALLAIYAKEMVPLDDPDRLTIRSSTIVDDMVKVDLRDVVNAVKTRHLAKDLKKALGRKPNLLLIYGGMHSARLPEYLDSQETLDEGIKRWEGKLEKYFQPEWINAMTLRRTVDGNMTKKVFRQAFPELGIRAGIQMLDPDTIKPIERTKTNKPHRPRDTIAT